MGPIAYKAIEDKIKDDDTDDLEYTKLKNLLNEHIYPSKSETIVLHTIYERIITHNLQSKKFNKRHKKENRL